jgi:SOS-response transcriptional repressor LexA
VDQEVKELAMEISLTSAQEELFFYIKQEINRVGRAPTIRQMMKAMGLKSPAPIQSRLRYLMEKGWICKDPMRGLCIKEGSREMFVLLTTETMEKIANATPGIIRVSDWVNELIATELDR